MPYKPKYCCQCGEKIDNADRKLLSSGRFCELCATDYGFYEWIPRLITGIGLLLTIFFISNYFQKSEKPLNAASNQFVGGFPGNKIAPANQSVQSIQSIAPPVQTANAVQSSAQNSNSALTVKAPVTTKISDLKSKQPGGSPAGVSEAVYFCGAATKKGTPCSRRVRGTGRCWQHTGQNAIASPEKLLISQ